MTISLADNLCAYKIHKTVLSTISSSSKALRKLSLYIHEHPELGYSEILAHDALTAFLEGHGFDVTRRWLLPTAFRASYTHGRGGRTFGLCSEYDALPGIGHACGHNL